MLPDAKLRLMQSRALCPFKVTKCRIALGEKLDDICREESTVGSAACVMRSQIATLGHDYSRAAMQAELAVSWVMEQVHQAALAQRLAVALRENDNRLAAGLISRELHANFARARWSVADEHFVSDLVRKKMGIEPAPN